MINRRRILISQQCGLPNEYQKVEYIQSTGSQFIDTGVNSNYNLIEVELEIQFDELYDEGSVFGVGTNNIRALYFFNNKNRFWLSAGNDLASRSTCHTNQLSTDIWYSFQAYLDNINRVTGCKINETQLNDYYFTGTARSDDNIFMFKCNGQETEKSKFKSCKIVVNNTMVRDFVYCYRKSDGVIGVYDLCGSICPLTNSPFYINAGSGVFEKGADV